MAFDWKSRLINAQAKAKKASSSSPTLQKAVEQVIAAGVPATEVKRFLAEHNDVFGDDALQAARRASESMLDSGKQAAVPPEPTTGVKAHAVRFQTTTGAVPWFQRASVLALPQPAIVLHGKGDVVVVDGERFSHSDLAALLRAA